jgi:large subunit ribosomal protein L23
MTIEMDKPFVWPANPDSFEAWGKEERKRNTKEGIDMAVEGEDKKKNAMRVLREQAKEILKGREMWERTRTGSVLGTDKKEYRVRV